MKNFLYPLLSFLICFSAQSQNSPELVVSLDKHPGEVNFILIDHGLPKMLVTSDSIIALYNPDQSLFQSIDLPENPLSSGYPLVGYISRSLFDCDSTNVEYLVSFATIDTSAVKVYRDDGTEFFDFGEVELFSMIGIDRMHKSIISDEEGSYIRFGDNQGGTVVYKLCGQVPQPLPRESDGTILSGIMQEGGNSGFHTYPNPTRDIIRFEYDLEGHRKANLQIFNTSGQLMKELMLGPAFDHIRLNVSELEEGTYIARIVTEDGFELSEKFVKVQ